MTLATVREHYRVAAGDIVATVKIIPFAVSRSRAEDCAAAAPGAVRVSPLVRHRAALILTRLPGVKDSVLDRAETNTRARLDRLGSQLDEVVRCAHDSEAVAAAIFDLRSRGYAPILILGASAIVDRNDVVPTAVRRAGGAIDHFGMPVDPGNLLLLGHHGDTAIIGVPGCARSLKPSGFDWVLERTLAGLAVSMSDIRAMGVGGLLAEVFIRPQPRGGRASLASSESAPAPAGSPEPSGSAGSTRSGPRVAGLLLAAGQSRRMGETNKLLAVVAGAPMVARAARALAGAELGPLVAVLGHQADAVRSTVSAAVPDRPFEYIDNPHYAQGMSTSLRAGVAALRGRCDAVVVCLGDMPWVTPDHVRILVDAFAPADGRAICVPVYRGKTGNPVLLSADFFPAISRISGDIGARTIIEDNPELVHRVTAADGGVLVDVDTAEALADLDAEPGQS
ncbi:MAG: NTP transferase domain-containing protein [Myxococcota bacterium]